ncbi:hypothetical protein DRQ12_10960, partial [candidate division KSB1 bacterium]
MCLRTVHFIPDSEKLMKDKKEISSLKGLRINGWSYLLQTFCPYQDRQEEVYQKAFLTAKFTKESQRAQTANYLFIKPSPALCPVPFFAVMLSDQLLIQDEDA